MRVVDLATDLPALLPRAVAIGTFDGVHLGHRHLLRRTHQAGLVSTVVTFDPHPRLVLGRPVRLISSLTRRLELLASLGVTDVLIVPFTLEMSRMPPEKWAAKVLRPMGTRRVVVGENYRFGHRASGGPATLRAMGFEVHAVSLASGASSTRIRQLVELGQLRTASELLGRKIEIRGSARRRPSEPEHRADAGDPATAEWTLPGHSAWRSGPRRARRDARPSARDLER
jgi:riboflavin kinase/FMN adenylyltransferase